MTILVQANRKATVTLITTYNRGYNDGVRIWRKQQEYMDPSRLISMVQAAGGGHTHTHTSTSPSTSRGQFLSMSFTESNLSKQMCSFSHGINC